MDWRICLVTSDPKGLKHIKMICLFSNLGTTDSGYYFLFFLVYRVILIQKLLFSLSFFTYKCSVTCTNEHGLLTYEVKYFCVTQ